MRFQALTDLYLWDGRIIQAGSEFDAPPGWKPPTNAVNAMDGDAQEAYQNEGPRGCDDAEPFRALFTNGQRWSDVRVPALKSWWTKVNGAWVLHNG